MKSTRSGEGFLYGDVNGDAAANDADALLIARYWMGLQDEAFMYPESADVNDDGLINISDALLVAQYADGMINGFLAEKNLFSNGHFHAGDKYWEFIEQYNGTGSMEAINGELKVSVNNGGDYIWSIGMAQTGFNLEAGKAYNLTFKARTASQTDTQSTSQTTSLLRTIFPNQQGSLKDYADKTFTIGSEMKTYSMLFTMPITDSQAKFTFYMGINNEVYIFIDDVSLYEVIPQNIIRNGDFSNGSAYWDLSFNGTESGNASLEIVNGELAVNIAQISGEAWNIGVEQNDLRITNGGNYTFSFKARADSPKNIRVAVRRVGNPDPDPVPNPDPEQQPDPNTVVPDYSDREEIMLTTEMQTYTYNFTMLNITDDAAQLVFYIGEDNTTFYLDDVILYKHYPNPVNMPTPMFKGLNLSDYFDAPAENAWGDPEDTMEEEYFQKIKDVGFDHFRIPVRWSTHAAYDAPYTIDSDFFERIDWAVNNSLSSGLITIIDMHHYHELFGDTIPLIGAEAYYPPESYDVSKIGPEKHRARFLAMWIQIATHYRNYPDELYFEIMNEPNTDLTPELWNEYSQAVVTIIKNIEGNETRKIVIDTAGWGSINALNDLVIPEGDPNIIVTFHPYKPGWKFCFSAAPWQTNPQNPPNSWYGTPEQRKYITGFLDYAVKWQKKHNNVPLWNGEFCAHGARMDSIVRWNTFITRECEKRGIANAYWSFMTGESTILFNANPEEAPDDSDPGFWIEERLDLLGALLYKE